MNAVTAVNWKVSHRLGIMVPPADNLSAEEPTMPIRDARTDVIIFPERDATLTPFARKLLEDFYLRSGETPQDRTLDLADMVKFAVD